MKPLAKLKEKVGFTLAELMIVIALLTVVAAVAVPSVASYAKSIRLRELDDSARAIYMAAQHEFSSMIAKGGDITTGSGEITKIPERYSSTDSAFTQKELDNILPNLKYAIVTKGVAPAGAAGLTNTGAIESELAENNYVIEYNAETGDVYGVFYSNETAFDESAEPDYQYDGTDPDKDVFKDAAAGNGGKHDKLVGFYGLVNVKIQEKEQAVTLPTPQVEVINKEKLVLTVSAPSGLDPKKDFYLKIVLFDDEGHQDIITKNECYLKSFNAKEIGFATFILDSLETGANTDPIGNLSGQTYEGSFAEWAPDLTPGANVTAKVSFYDKNGVNLDQTVEVTFNSLFANGSKRINDKFEYVDNGEYLEASIEYGRHLQNLTNAPQVTSVSIDKTIDFKKTTGTSGDYERWGDVYGYNKAFVAVTTNATSISAKPGVQIRYLNTETGGIFDSLTNATVENLIVVNPKVTGYFSGAIAGSAFGLGDDFGSFKNCAVYIEAGDGDNWDDPAKDPYTNYTISGNFSAGGLVGSAAKVNFENCIAAVKVSAGTAGGLVGIGGGNVISDCAVLGHTYEGKFDGTYQKTPTEQGEIKLKDNISGTEYAGGLIGHIEGTLDDGDGEAGAILKGTVFTSCSVKGQNANPICPDDTTKTDDDVKAEGENVFTLGKAYDNDGKEISSPELPENVKNADEAKVDTLNNVGKRYDNRVGSSLKYPVPAGVTLRGDWPSSDSVTGFFYWEKHGSEYNFHILCNGDEYYDLCDEQDGIAIAESGYGLFSIGGDVTKAEYSKRSRAVWDPLSSETTLSDILGEVDSTEKDEIVESLITALNGEKLHLNSTKEKLNYEICKTIGDDEKASGNIKVTLNGKTFAFAPCFYGIADGDSTSFGKNETPFAIRTAQHLKNIKFFLKTENFYYEQEHDILPGTIEPIGTDESPFKGTYNGGSYRIIDAQVAPGSGAAGLFGVTENATLKNIVLFHPADTAGGFIPFAVEGENPANPSVVGGIVGTANGSTVENCVVAGYIITGDTAGGIVGASTETITVTGCEANIQFGKIGGGDPTAGGIVGNGEGATVSNCYALVHGIDSPKSSMKLGGIAGKANSVTNCYVIFAGQTAGYPVANAGDSTNYYASDDGYCSISEDYVKVGKGLHLYNAKAGQTTLMAEKKSHYGQISYTNDVKKDETNKYDLTAVVLDKVAGELSGNDIYVHYGPMPIEADTSGGYLSNGPLAGVFNFYYNYSWDTNAFDGLMVYNKFGKVYSSEYKSGGTPISPDQLSPEKPVGVFVLKAENSSGKIMSPADYGLRIEVNGITWTSFELMKDAYLVQGQGYLFYPRDSDYNVIDHLQDTTYPGHGNYTDPSQRFSFWKITDIEPENVNKIEIFYTPEGEKEGRLLLTNREDNFNAIIPKAYVDDRIPPIVGAFYVNTNSPNGSGFYARAMLSNGAVIVPSVSTWEFANKLGIVVETSRLAYDLDYIVAYYDYTPYKLTQWDDVTNKEDFEGYTLFLMDDIIFDESIGAKPTNFNIEIGYGSKLIYFAKEGNGVPDASVYAPKEIRAKVGTVIYKSEGSGYYTAVARMGDGRFIGESTGEMRDLGVILSPDMSIDDIRITVKRGNAEFTPQIKEALNVTNKDLFNGYKVYLLVDENGASISNDFKMTVKSVSGSVILQSSEY